ncbi:MAG: DUF3685 domain-containing protein [Halothece sp.]
MLDSRFLVNSDRAIKIFLLDADTVFLEGLRQVLNAQDDMEIIAQALTLQQARDQLSTLETLPNVFILEINLEEPLTASIEFCQEIKQTYPNLPLFLLTTVTDGKILGSLRRLGIEGYARKRTPVEELINALRQVARGELYWQQGIESSSLQLSPPASPQPVTPPRWLTRQREAGLSEIENNLAQVEANLNKDDLSTFDWLFWQGLRRELRVAHWIVKQLLPVEVVVVNEDQTEEETETPPHSEIIPPQLTVFPTSVSETLFQTTLGKIQLGLVNKTDNTLEIDLLNPEKKRELLYLVVQQFQELLQQLKFIQLPIENLPERRSRLLRELWQNCLSKWISTYIPETAISQLAPSISDFILREVPFVEQTTLNKIPQVSPLFAYLLYQQPLKIDQVSYRPESPEAQSRAETLFHHLILQIANAVMQVILNQFGEQETVKTTLYQEKYRSSRAIARFRNELSWQYRRFYYVEEPKAIFESRYELLVLRGNRIQSSSIYAPRQAELEELQGLRWSVTIALELRDAIAPRLQAIVGVVGQALVYLLTQVIGRGLGLIGRGILQGIGKSVEDQRNQR